MNAASKLALLVVAASGLVAARAGLSTDELKLLQDAGGWQYVTVSDRDAGIQTQHVCFDGQPHPDQCSGTLRFHPDKTFVKQITIHGQNVDRHGTYQLDDNQVSFYDEFGNRDGPYDMELNPKTKILVLSMPQIRIELELEGQYQDDLQKRKAPPH